MRENQQKTIEAHRFYQKGRRLQHAGRLNEAVSELNKAIECNARYAEAYFHRGACHYMLGHYQFARNDMNAAALLGCEEAQLWSKYDSSSYNDNKIG